MFLTKPNLILTYSYKIETPEIKVIKGWKSHVLSRSFIKCNREFMQGKIILNE